MMCASLNLTGEGKDYKCLFMPDNVDYARRFEDQLSFFLYNVINNVDLTEEGSISSTQVTISSSVNEDEYDLRKLLSHMQLNSKHFAKHFAMNPDLLYCYCFLLKQIANELAHKVYLTPQYQGTGASSHVAGKGAYIDVYLEYGYDLAMQIMQGPDQVLQHWQINASF